MKNGWKNKYRKMLYNTDIPLRELSMYVNENMPRYLYKYRSFNEYWESTLFEGLVYFPDALSLNDPFDCHVYIDVNRFTSFMDEFASKYIFPNNSLDEIHKAYNTRIKNNLKVAYGRIKRDTLLTCFSENVNSILMWSHYSECHRGFCIEYDTKKIDMEYKRFLFPVTYEREVFDYTDIAIMNELLNLLFLNVIKEKKTIIEYNLKYIDNTMIPMLIKSKEWNYEKEWRIIVPSYIFGPNEHFIFLGDAIKGVYLGANCNENGLQVRAIIEWAKKKKINVYKMEKELSTYKLTSKVFL